jgi:cell division protein FtsQ
VKRSSQAIRSWRTGPLIWRPGSRGRRLDLHGDAGSGALVWATRLLIWRRGRIVILSVLAACLVLGGAWLWLRDSPLVSVQQVTITGASGPDASAIRTALVASARSMTTLDVQTRRLYAAVSAYPVVRSLRVSTQFPHGMRIRVIEQLPVAAVVVAGRRIAVAADGTLLHDMAAPAALPTLVLAIPPGGLRLTDPTSLEVLAAARTAPRPLRSRLGRISLSSGGGLVAQVRGGPAVFLGDSSRLRVKWAAVLAVLADPGSAGSSYIDVTDPERPAAGATMPSSAPGTHR